MHELFDTLSRNRMGRGVIYETHTNIWPPASGKLTIAKEIVKKTKLKLFHNHSVIDLCFSILDKTSPKTWKFIQKIRIEVIKEAIKQKVSGLVMTMAYTGETEYISKIIKTVEKNKGKIYLIKLECDANTLKKRVASKARKQHGKLTSKKGLDDWLDKFNGGSKITQRKNMILNNSNMTAKKAAEKIIKYIN